MYQTKVTTTTKTNTKSLDQSQRVSNPIGYEIPKNNMVETEQDYQHKLITNIMFWSLGAVAITLFYLALSSLML